VNRLYLLGFTHDLQGVVFSQRKNGKTGTFWVPIDENFMGAVSKLERARRDQARKETPRKKTKGVVDPKGLPSAKPRVLPPVGRSQARSGLPASDIQQMLRAGRSTKSVAAAAKTPLAWVERLAEPVITERIGVVRLAQRAYMIRPRLGTSGLQLGEAVRRNLEDRRASTDTIEGLDDAWDAKMYASAGGTWRIWVRFSHRGRRQSAEWEFKKGSRQITPRNRLAGELGWWAPEPEPEQEEVDDLSEDPAAEEAPRRAPAKPRRRPPVRRAAKRRAPARKKNKSRRPASRRRR
jgi:hypothetical protein